MLLTVYADGREDNRQGEQLSISQRFFDLQTNEIDGKLEKFKIKLNITNQVFNGHQLVDSFGLSYLNVFINNPPENGTCEITKGTGTFDNNNNEIHVSATNGKALLDKFKINCNKWGDRDGHQITKYQFKSE